MTDSEAGRPQDRLHRLAKANIILGIVSLVRLVPELVTGFLMSGPPPWKYLALLAVDTLVGALWLWSGVALRRQPGRDIAFAALAGALVFSHSITSGWFIGRELVAHLLPSRHSSEYLILVALSGSRLFIYAIEFFSQPFLLIQLRKGAAPEDSSAGRRMGVTIIGWFLIAGLVQTLFFSTLMDR